MMMDAFAELARRQRTLLVGTVAPASVWHLTALTVERFPGTLLNPVTLVFEQLVRTTGLVSSVTNVTQAHRSGFDRVAVPIVDADGHATFYLSALADAPQRVQDIYDWIYAQ